MWRTGGPPETLAAAGLAPDAYAALITTFSTVPEVIYFDVAAVLIGRVADRAQAAIRARAAGLR